MKIKRSVLEQIVKEELASYARSLVEAPKEKASVVDADDEKRAKEKEGGKGTEAPTKPQKGPEQPKQPSKKAAPAGQEEPKELPAGEEPEADDELDKNAASEEDAEEDAEEVTGGKIADAVTGKTVQSITMEPESKILPGAQEVTLTFREIPDPLKILITKSGQVKFHFRGLHNTLGEATEPSVDSPVPDTVNPGNVTKKTNHIDKFSMSNDEYLGWLKNPPHNLKVISAQGGKPIADMNQQQIKWALSKAAFMKGLAKGVNGEAEYWTAPIVRRK